MLPKFYTLNEFIELFIEDCELRNLREHTIKYYRNELKAFRNLLLAKEITGEIIKYDVIKYMKERNLKSVTINTRLRAFKAFFNLLEQQKSITS